MRKILNRVQLLVFVDDINVSPVILTHTSTYGIDVLIQPCRVCGQTCNYAYIITHLSLAFESFTIIILLNHRNNVALTFYFGMVERSISTFLSFNFIVCALFVEEHLAVLTHVALFHLHNARWMHELN